MNIHEEDYPYSIYKRPEGDELLDAHNDIIAVFDPHTEPEIERMIAASPEMKGLLYKAHEKLADLNNNYELGDDNPVDLCFEIRNILHRIDGEGGSNG